MRQSSISADNLTKPPTLERLKEELNNGTGSLVSYTREVITVPAKKDPPYTNPSLKDEELYEKLRDEGASKQKAARISNAAAKSGRSAVGKRGGKSGNYDDWTVTELRKRAQEIGLKGYSSQRKADLIESLRNS